MKNTKKMAIVTVIAILLIALIVIFFIFLPKLQKEQLKRELEVSLEEKVVDSYENGFKKYMPNYLKENGHLKITLEYLDGMKEDISKFDENKCDHEETFVNLVYDSSNETYKTEIHLQCEL